jgi:hypothetical protein
LDWEKSYKAAIHVGISNQEYDEMTPYQLNLYIEDYNARKKVDTEEKLALAWLSAYWQRAKRMPSFSKVLKDLHEEPKHEMTPEEILAQVKSLNAALGGNTY